MENEADRIGLEKHSLVVTRPQRFAVRNLAAPQLIFAANIRRAGKRRGERLTAVVPARGNNGEDTAEKRRVGQFQVADQGQPGSDSKCR